MPEFLETTFDKFTFKVARDRMYTRDGVWLLATTAAGGLTVQLGITDYLQQHSGDIAFVNLEKVGTAISAGDDFAEIETIKVNVGLPSPISGSILELNRALERNPEFVNQDPYGKGWLILMRPNSWELESSKLLDANSYFDFMRTEIEQELETS